MGSCMEFALEKLLWFCTGQLVLLSLILFFQKGRIYQLLAALGISILGHLIVNSTVQIPHTLFLILEWWALQPLPLFYLLTAAVFKDDFELMGWHLVPVLLLPLLGLFLIEWRELVFPADQDFWSRAFQSLPQILMASFLFPSVHNILSGLSQDLIVWRYRLRPYLAAFVALVLATVLAVEIYFGHAAVPGYLGLLKLIVIILLVNVLSIVLLRAEPGALTPAGGAIRGLHSSSHVPVSEADRQLMIDLQRAMEEDRVFLREGLSIGDLARHLCCQEYRLRKLINRQLGHPNFNQFLNHYRVEQARKWLHDPDRREHTVLRIAFDLGYQSLAPFNVAFKKITGMTPVEYRRTGR